MKYQQLENLECGWKWAYLVKNTAKVRKLPVIRKKRAEEAVAQLLKLESHPVKVTVWIQNIWHRDWRTG